MEHNLRLTDILVELGQLVVVIWGLTEIMSRIFTTVKKEITALIIGMGLTVAVVLLGYVNIDPPGAEAGFPLWEKILAALLLGACEVGASSLLNDKIANPFRDGASKILSWLKEKQ